jgi:hypothetical protein
LKSMLDDLYDTQKKATELGRSSFEITNGDGRILDSVGIENDRFDLIIYSPPYLNNIDYSEVYKLELWMSGLINNQQEFKNLRLSTFRSHPSVKFPETQIISALPQDSWPKRLTEQIISAIPQNGDHEWRKRLISSYCDDILVSLQNQYKVLMEGSLAVCVVGNSLHGNSKENFCVATDLIISAIAKEVGFEIVDLKVARYLKRRRSTQYAKLLRESIIVLRK